MLSDNSLTGRKTLAFAFLFSERWLIKAAVSLLISTVIIILAVSSYFIVVAITVVYTDKEIKSKPKPKPKPNNDDYYSDKTFDIGII